MFDELYAAGLVAAGTGLLFAYQCYTRNSAQQGAIQSDDTRQLSCVPLTDILAQKLLSQTNNTDATHSAENAAKGDRLYNSIQAVVDYLMPFQLASEGILNKKGNLSQSIAIYELIATKNDNPVASALPLTGQVHDIVGALNLAINDNIQEIYFAGEILLQNLQALGNVWQPQMILETFVNHINLLREHGKGKEAAIMHDLLHIGYNVQIFEEYNRMPVANVAMALTPVFQKLMRTPSHFVLIDKALQTILTQPCFEKRFTQSYANSFAREHSVRRPC